MRLSAHEVLAIGVDYQERLIPAIHDKESLLRNSRILFTGLDLLDVPILISRQYPKGLGDTVPEIREVAGKARTLDKITFSCYQPGALKEEVDASGRRTVILSGTETHVCVLQTAIDLLAAGFRVVFV
ncbi:MAG: isochorismatase family protein, partial [Desulfovibrio sp.]|nr:isochorismatase family protein [Desulfovibrio sp.]